MPMTPAERSARYRAKDPDAYRKRKREYARTPAEREKRRAYMEEWRSKNREHYNRWAREYHHRRKEDIQPKTRGWRLKFYYGITEKEYESMLEAQGGKCAICKNPPKGGSRSKHLHIDHDHDSGKIRGLLCLRCNTRLEWAMIHKEQISAYLHSGRVW